MQEAIDQLVQGQDSLQNSLEDLESQKRDAAEKLRRKKLEFERMEQRLMQLKNVRAPYQDEVDALELELSGLYGVYMTRFRSLEYLEFKLSKIRRCGATRGILPLLLMLPCGILIDNVNCVLCGCNLISTAFLAEVLETLSKGRLSCRSEEERMKTEEAKLERLRKKLADRELQIVRGQIAINERDLNELVSTAGGEESEESLTMPSAPEGLHSSVYIMHSTTYSAFMGSVESHVCA